MSTEKRFINVNHEIWQGNDVWCVAGGEHCADVIATALNEQHETITEQASQIDFLKDENKHMRTVLSENKELKQRNNRQKDTITKQQEQIDNYINIKAKLNAKIKEYETKSEEYELGACICGARKYAFKMQALAEFKEGIYENKNNNEFQS